MGSASQLGKGSTQEGAVDLPFPPLLHALLPARGHFGMLIGNTSFRHSVSKPPSSECSGVAGWEFGGARKT